MVWMLKRSLPFRNRKNRTVCCSSSFMLRFNKNAHSLPETRSERKEVSGVHSDRCGKPLPASRDQNKGGDNLHHLFSSFPWKLPFQGIWVTERGRSELGTWKCSQKKHQAPGTGGGEQARQKLYCNLHQIHGPHACVHVGGNYDNGSQAIYFASLYYI